MDPIYGVLQAEKFSPDFLIKNPSFFRAKKGSDPDTPSISEALSGQYRSKFIEAIAICMVPRGLSIGLWRP